MSSSATLTAPEGVIEIIKRAIVDELGLTLVGQLDRKQYEAVNKFLLASGLVWSKKSKKHLFQTPGALGKIMSLIATGEVRDDKKHFQEFYTPLDLVDRMIDEAHVKHGDHVLEPSSGDGRIVRALREPDKQCYIVSIDIDPAKKCEWSDEHFDGDFLDFRIGEIGTYNRVLMNSPFTNGQDVRHISHARSFLRENGTLVAICANGPKQQEILKPMAEESGGFYEPLPANTFKESGTGVNAALLVIEK